MSVNLPIEHFAQWLANGERGLSSEAIVEHLTGVRVGRYGGFGVDHPYDAGDFRRCEMLLRAHPLARLMFVAMRTASPAWARLVDAWDELVALAESEGVSASDRWNAPMTSARVYELIRKPDAS